MSPKLCFVSAATGAASDPPSPGEAELHRQGRAEAGALARGGTLVEPAPPWHRAAMSPLATTDPKELRPLLRERIEHATDEELEAVRKALLKLEIHHVREELGREVDELEAAGELTPEKVGESVRAHRARHPYG